MQGPNIVNIVNVNNKTDDKNVFPVLIIINRYTLYFIRKYIFIFILEDNMGFYRFL